MSFRVLIFVDIIIMTLNTRRRCLVKAFFQAFISLIVLSHYLLEDNRKQFFFVLLHDDTSSNPEKKMVFVVWQQRLRGERKLLSEKFHRVCEHFQFSLP